MNNYRFLYNKAVGILNIDCYSKNDPYSGIIQRLGEVEKKSSYGNGYSKFDLRNLLVPEEVNSRTPWLLETGSSIRSKAVFEAHKSWKTNVDLVKSGARRFFDLRYKTKKNVKWTFDIEHANVKTRLDAYGNTEFSLYEESGFIKSTESFQIDQDSSIHFDGKYYYILVPYTTVCKYSSADNFHVALDPGSRKFQVSYSPDENINIIGKGASEKIYKLLLMVDKAISTKNKRLEIKLRRRISNLQNELHNKTAKFLCENYRNIYIPKLTSDNDIINKNTRRIKTKTVRAMVVLAHCKFVEKLKTKALEYKNINVHVVTEEYTSQTCLKCHKKTKTTDETFECLHCGFEIDRDILGSRNILLKTWNLM